MQCQRSSELASVMAIIGTLNLSWPRPIYVIRYATSVDTYSSDPTNSFKKSPNNCKHAWHEVKNTPSWKAAAYTSQRKTSGTGSYACRALLPVHKYGRP